MFPNLDNYDSNDVRQLMLYSWHFDLFALKEIIEVTKNTIDGSIKQLIKFSLENTNNPFINSETMMKVQEYHNIEPLSYQSYLLSLYSVVEAALDRYCLVCEEKMELKVKLEDLKDKGITRSVTYLEKVVELEIIKSDNRWGKMKLINELRNDLIHRCGYIGQDKKIKKYSSELNVEVEGGKIYLLYENILDIYNYIDKFMEFVFTRNFTNREKNLLTILNKVE